MNRCVGVFALAAVALWAATNALMAAMLADFVAAALVFLLALLVVLARRRRRPVERGYCLPAGIVLLAVTAALLWPGLPFGIWVPMLVRCRSPRPC